VPNDFEKLSFDSALFGFPVARIQLRAFAPKDLDEALTALREEGIRLAYWTLNELPEAERRKVETKGGVLVDRKFTYETLPFTPPPAESSLLVFDYCSPAPNPALYALALESGSYSRFRRDPRIPPGCYEAMYRAWIDNSVSKKIADRVFVTGEESNPTGLLTVGRRNGIGDIGLVAVSAAERGKGAGSALVQRARRWFHEQGFDKGRVVTQGENEAACRLYEKNGFKLLSAEHTFHFWL
jgi:dTDP-4-amino-4,6-dideoxy-D-galactose acyltransferase